MGGLFSDPMGFFFGDDDEMGVFDNPVRFMLGADGKGNGAERGVIDRRVNREPEGQRWWERWEQTFGQGGPMDPMSVYPRSLAALETLMQQYFPGWGGNQMFTAPLGPGAGGGMGKAQQGNKSNFQDRPAPVGGNSMPGLLEMTPGGDGVWGAVKSASSDSGFDPTGGARSPVVQRLIDSPKMSARQVPTYEFSPDDLTAAASPQGYQDMSYRLKKPGEPGYDPVRDRDPFADAGFKTMPVGEGVAMTPAPTNGGSSTPGLLEPTTISIGGMRLPLVTKHDRMKQDLAFRYIAALTGMMDPWLQGGMELERGRYGAPYNNQSSGGLFGGALNSFGETFGKGIGGAALEGIFG